MAPCPRGTLTGTKENPDAKLQAAAGDQVGRTCIFGHVKRVLVAHVDDRCADLYAAGLRTNCGKQRKR
jgi:hypothetical protein